MSIGWISKTESFRFPSHSFSNPPSSRNRPTSPPHYYSYNYYYKSQYYLLTNPSQPTIPTTYPTTTSHNHPNHPPNSQLSLFLLPPSMNISALVHTQANQQHPPPPSIVPPATLLDPYVISLPVPALVSLRRTPLLPAARWLLAAGRWRLTVAGRPTGRLTKRLPATTRRSRGPGVRISSLSTTRKRDDTE